MCSQCTKLIMNCLFFVLIVARMSINLTESLDLAIAPSGVTVGAPWGGFSGWHPTPPHPSKLGAFFYRFY
jgi:hypothetical protein